MDIYSIGSEEDDNRKLSSGIFQTAKWKHKIIKKQQQKRTIIVNYLKMPVEYLRAYLCSALLTTFATCLSHIIGDLSKSKKYILWVHFGVPSIYTSLIPTKQDALQLFYKQKCSTSKNCRARLLRSRAIDAVQ